MNSKLAGRWGEEMAAKYLEKKGYRLIAAGYRCRFGEIDLILKKGATVVFAEVKLRRSSSFASAADNVTGAKRQRIKAAARMWLAEKDDDSPVRFDVIEVYAGT
jgi:putative endonuclease